MKNILLKIMAVVALTTLLGNSVVQAVSESAYSMAQQEGQATNTYAINKNQIPFEALPWDQRVVRQQQAQQEFFVAVAQGNLAHVKNCIVAGADLNAEDSEGFTALLRAVSNGDAAMVELLLKNDVDVDKQDMLGTTALVSAAADGHVAIVAMLVHASANLNISNKFGCTALIYAIGNNHTAVAELLIKAGAHLNAQDQLGNTALILAAYKSPVSIVGLLLAKGADVNKQTKEGFTALMVAASSNEKKVVELLLKHPATQVLLRNAKGKTAEDLASETIANMISDSAAYKKQTQSWAEWFLSRRSKL